MQNLVSLFVINYLRHVFQERILWWKQEKLHLSSDQRLNLNGNSKHRRKSRDVIRRSSSRSDTFDRRLRTKTDQSLDESVKVTRGCQLRSYLEICSVFNITWENTIFPPLSVQTINRLGVFHVSSVPNVCTRMLCATPYWSFSSTDLSNTSSLSSFVILKSDFENCNKFAPQKEFLHENWFCFSEKYFNRIGK